MSLTGRRRKGPSASRQGRVANPTTQGGQGSLPIEKARTTYVPPLAQTAGRQAALGAAVLIAQAAGANGAVAKDNRGQWSDEEQQFLYELNRVRWDPTLGGFATAAVLPAPPLAANPALAAAAGSRADEMAEFDYFAHQSPVTGLWPNQLARAFGYPLPRFWPDQANNIESIHFGQPTVSGALQSLLDSPGHRPHLMGEGWYGTHREVGVGAHLGERIWSFMTANDASTRVFLTGVAYRDANRNHRMDLGEGLGGVTITAGNYATVTNSAGGWALSVPPGGYRVVASGGRFRDEAAATLRVGAYNIEVDFRSGRPRAQVFAYQTCAGRAPTILGTNAGEHIQGTPGDDVIHGLGGNDIIDGGGGHDIICGGTGNDRLVGEGAVLHGGPGRDSCTLGKRQLNCEGA